MKTSRAITWCHYVHCVPCLLPQVCTLCTVNNINSMYTHIGDVFYNVRQSLYGSGLRNTVMFQRFFFECSYFVFIMGREIKLPSSELSKRNKKHFWTPRTKHLKSENDQ